MSSFLGTRRVLVAGVPAVLVGWVLLIEGAPFWVIVLTQTMIMVGVTTTLALLNVPRDRRLHDESPEPWEDPKYWFEYPTPSRRHECGAVSSGWTGQIFAERCPCGAVRIDGGPWLDRNSRRSR